MDILPTKRNSLKEEHKAAKREQRRKPRRLVITTAITTRKHRKRVPTPEKKNPRKQIRQSRNFNK